MKHNFQLTINDVISKEMGVHPKDFDHFIKCPFHSGDNTPSLRIYPSSDDGEGSYFCWGCKSSGTPVHFVKQFHEYRTWYEVYSHIEREYGIVVEKVDFSRKVDETLVFYINTLKNKITDVRHIRALEVAILLYIRNQDKMAIEKVINKYSVEI